MNRSAPRAAAGALRLVAMIALAGTLGSCAYYNTYFMARRYYNQATHGQPYVVDKADPSQAVNFGKSVDYCKKLIGNYPKSKWVDDATLLWARNLIGKDDPGAAVDMLRDFTDHYPNTPLRAEATFYLGLAYRLSHKYSEAVTAFEESRRLAPRGPLVPYAYLEESRAMTSLQHYDAAAALADTLATRFEKHTLHDAALLARADARMALGDYVDARADYRTLGSRATSDDDRFQWLLKEADCVEAGHDDQGALALLKDALSHETEPVLSDTSGKIGFIPTRRTGGGDRWGQLKLRVGSVYTMMGKEKEALAEFDDVMLHYWRTPLAAEAQYRKGYVYEVVGDDFDAARAEYAKVRDQSAASVYSTQASQRMANLDRLAQFRVAGGDSVAKEAEAAFMRAELYLFQSDKPQRALEEYRGVVRRFPGTGWDAKALLAEAWVRCNRMRDSTGSDSLLWAIVREHPATEAQLAARDYLEARGEEVPDTLIRLPEHPLLAADTTRLTPPPATTAALGTGRSAFADSALRLGLRGGLYGNTSDYRHEAPRDPGGPGRTRVDASIDSLASVVARTDSLTRAAARADSLARMRPAPADSGGSAPPPPPYGPPAPVPLPVTAKPDSLP